MAAKVFFVLLVLVAVAFFLTMRVGAKRHEQRLPDGDDQRTSYVESNPPPSWIASLIGPLSPKLELPRKTFQFGTADLGPMTPGLVVEVPEGKPQFRNATLHVITGCRAATDCSNVVIRYQSKNGEGHDLKLDKQAWRPSKDKPDQASFVVLQHGGTVQMSCPQTPRCTAELR